MDQPGQHASFSQSAGEGIEMIDESKRQDPCAKPQTTASASLQERLAPSIREELESLRKHEPKLLEALNADPKRAAAFLADPARELKRAGIKLPSGLRSALKPVQGLEEFLSPASLRLPNGQIVTPKVRIRITGGV